MTNLKSFSISLLLQTVHPSCQYSSVLHKSVEVVFGVIITQFLDCS